MFRALELIPVRIGPRPSYTVRLLLDRGADVSTQGGFYANALQAAAWWGPRRRTCNFVSVTQKQVEQLTRYRVPLASIGREIG